MFYLKMLQTVAFLRERSVTSLLWARVTSDTEMLAKMDSKSRPSGQNLSANLARPSTFPVASNTALTALPTGRLSVHDELILGHLVKQLLSLFAFFRCWLSFSF